MVFACGDEFSPLVGRADGNDGDLLSDDGAWAWEGGVGVEGGLEAAERFVFVVAVDGDLRDQVVEVAFPPPRTGEPESAPLTPWCSSLRKVV